MRFPSSLPPRVRRKLYVGSSGGGVRKLKTLNTQEQSVTKFCFYCPQLIENDSSPPKKQSLLNSWAIRAEQSKLGGALNTLYIYIYNVPKYIIYIFGGGGGYPSGPYGGPDGGTYYLYLIKNPLSRGDPVNVLFIFNKESVLYILYNFTIGRTNARRAPTYIIYIKPLYNYI